MYKNFLISGPLHRFPKPEYPHLEKFNSWKKVLDKALQEKGDIYIYNQIRFCDRHFEECYRSASHRLTPNAIPTLGTYYLDVLCYLNLNRNKTTFLCLRCNNKIVPQILNKIFY